MAVSQIKRLAAADYPRMPWRNGGGVTAEVACNEGGSIAGFEWRLSIAEVGQDGPFSRFTGMQRIIAVLEGAGIEMTVEGQRQAPLLPQHPYAFSGDSGVQCRLLDGPIRDFNLIYSPAHYQARLQWLGEKNAVRFHSSASTVIVFNAGAALQVVVDGRAAEGLTHHDCLQIETAGGLSEYVLQAQTGDLNACLIELQRRA